MSATARSNKRQRNDDDAAEKDSSTPSSIDPMALSQLIHCISREKLEGLLSSSILSNKALTVQDVQNALPENMKWKAKNVIQIKSKSKSNNNNNGKEKITIAKGQSRVGTGLFDTINDDVMKMIFMNLPLEDRMICVTRVCRPWMDFKTQEFYQDLWADLTQFRDLQYSGRWQGCDIRAEKILKLLDWVTFPEKITAIHINTTKTCNPNTCKAIVKKLIEVKKPRNNKRGKKGGESQNTSTIKNSTASSVVPSAAAPLPISKLVVSGPKVTSAAFKAIISNPLIVGPGLKSFELKDDVKEYQLDNLIPDVLSKCSNLSELQLPPNTAKNLFGAHSYLNALSRARGNNPSLLRVLDISGGFLFHQQMTFDMLSSLSNICPELEVLKVVMISGLPYRDFPPKYSAFNDTDRTARGDEEPDFLAQPLQVFPRLKTFHVDKLMDDKHYTTSASIQLLLPWIFAGTPILEDFSLNVGSYYLSRKDEKVFRYPPTPSLGKALSTIPKKTIRRIELHHMVVEASDLLETLSPKSSFPQLQHIILDWCGPSSLDAITQLSLKYKHLKVGVRKASLYNINRIHPDELQLAQGKYVGVCLSSIVPSTCYNRGFVTVEEAENTPMERI